MDYLDQYPIQTRSWRKVVKPERGHFYPRAGIWLQCYSSLLGRWCNIKWLGETEETKQKGD